MRNVAVTVDDGAGPPGLLGLYEGIPLTSRTSQYAGVLPDRITIYRQAICAICGTEQEVAGQVRRTVIHEIGHHFGIDDTRLPRTRLVSHRHGLRSTLICMLMGRAVRLPAWRHRTDGAGGQEIASSMRGAALNFVSATPQSMKPAAR